MNINYQPRPLLIQVLLLLSCLTSFLENGYGANKTSNGSGAWNTPGNWSPSGVPATGDQVTILNGHTLQINQDYSISNLTINSGGTLTFSPNKVLTITGIITVNGTVTMNRSDILLSTSGAAFTLGPGASFTWEPKNNTLAAATLFTNGSENLSPTSTLIIKKWYDYSVPLGSVVSGNFGNLTLNSPNGPWLSEWNQNNQFQTHLIQGTLTIDQGWIVMDKSGSISNTTIGNIALLNSNSYLDFHGGTHSGSFTVNTTNITVSGGMLDGIYDGNGNVTLNVTGDVSIASGNFFLINNDGVSNVGNGNCTMTVNGNFTQNSGSFRGIYNLTTYASGISDLTFNNLSVNGGIFMGHYGCHTAGGTNNFTVNGDLSVSLTSSSGIFRMVGLSQLSSTLNNVRLNCTIAGNFFTSGHSSAEVLSNVSSGSETVVINGNTTFGGCTNSFDYGVSSSAHAFSITIAGNLTVTSGTVYLSRIGGHGMVTVNGDATISGGTLIAKGDVGTQTLTINGNFIQSSGTFYLHKNSGINTTDAVQVITNGNFTHSGGTINFDDNTSSLAATHTLTINGASYNLTGAGTMTHASAGTGTVFGQIYFNRPGTITFTRSSASHSIQQVRQCVNSGCTLDVNSGNIQVASHSTAATNYFTVAGGGILKMNSNQLLSNGTSTNSGMRVEAGGLMKISKTTGLYDGTSSGTINSSNSMNYYLDAASTIEYTGSDNQVVTGTGAGLATTANHKYGNLKINFNGTADAEYVYPTASNVYVRNNLHLETGEFKLNNFTVTIENGATTAITRNSGYIKSETNAAVNGSILKWMNLTSGDHLFPFGVNSSEYIPITFNPSAGMGGYAAIATRATLNPNNTPWAGISNVAAVTNMNKNGTDVSTDFVIDRWYNFDAPGITADVTLSYRGSENTTLPGSAHGSFSIQNWNGTQWSIPYGSSAGTTTGIGSIFIPNATGFSPWIIVSSSGALPIELTSFDARAQGNAVIIDWVTASEKNNDYFTIERSSDGKNYLPLEEVDGAGNSSKKLSYTTTDQFPLSGTSYYRLKQTDFDGKFSYSKPVVVKFNITGDGDTDVRQLEILGISPNPFKDQFSVSYYSAGDDQVTFQLINTNGQVIFTQQVQAVNGNNRFDYLEGYKINAGSYVLIITRNGTKVSKKLIKNM